MAGVSIADASGKHWRKTALSFMMTSEHFFAASPIKRTFPSLRYCPKLSGTKISGAVSRICFPSAVKTAVYASMRLASIIGTMYLHPSGSRCLSMACQTSTSRVPTAVRGSFPPKHSPLAVETPTRSPVYEPGPLLTHTASQSESLSPSSSSDSCTNAAVRDAWARGVELSL